MTAYHRLRPRRTLTVPIRLFIAAVVIFTVVIGWVLFLLINANASLNHYVKNAHSQRLVNQADTEKQIRDLACIVVKPFPDTAGEPIKDLRAKYHCPPFNPANAPRPSKSATNRAAVRPSPTSTTLTTGHSTVVADAGHRVTVPGPVVTRTVPAPRPTPTPSPTSTKPTTPHPTPRTTPPILVLGNSTCTVGALGICILGR